jgi:glycosyltransferase involved in cell wall biosynthesis
VATQIPRRYALVFLGRPVAQKGWLPFLQIVEQLDWPCLGIIPYQPKDRIPANLTVLVGAQDDAVAAGLRESKILILPSDYESFGFAQAEALLSGCCVPILGEWPLWLNVPELDWRGLSPPQTAQRVREILADPERLSQLRSRQMQSWNLRAERQAPALPPLHG